MSLHKANLVLPLRGFWSSLSGKPRDYREGGIHLLLSYDKCKVTAVGPDLEAPWMRFRYTGFTSTPFRLEFLFSVLLTYRTYRSHKSMLTLSKGCKIEYFRERRDQGESSVAKTLTHAPWLYTHSTHWAVSS